MTYTKQTSLLTLAFALSLCVACHAAHADDMMKSDSTLSGTAADTMMKKEDAAKMVPSNTMMKASDTMKKTDAITKKSDVMNKSDAMTKSAPDAMAPASDMSK